MTIEEVKKLLGLKPHPVEGGWFVRTYEAAETIAAEAFSDGRYAGPRRTGTAIYYLLEPDTFSEMHRLKSDEVFHFYMGDAVELLRLYPDGTGERTVIGNAFESRSHCTCRHPSAKCSDGFSMQRDRRVRRVQSSPSGGSTWR